MMSSFYYQAGAVAPAPFALASGEPPRAVVFDLDGTLIDADVTVDWTDWLYSEGVVTDPCYRRSTERMVDDYRRGRLDMQRFLTEMMPSIAGLSADELERLVERFIASVIAPSAFPEGKRAVWRAKAAGIPVMILSASATFLVKAAARVFDVEDAVGIDLVEKNGIPTDRIEGIMTFREGKVARLESLGIPPEKVYFFTDSRNDLPLALRAGGVTVVNPDPLLEGEARGRGWPVLHWERHRRASESAAS